MMIIIIIIIVDGVVVVLLFVTTDAFDNVAVFVGNLLWLLFRDAVGTSRSGKCTVILLVGILQKPLAAAVAASREIIHTHTHMFGGRLGRKCLDDNTVVNSLAGGLAQPLETSVHRLRCVSLFVSFVPDSTAVREFGWCLTRCGWMDWIGLDGDG